MKDKCYIITAPDGQTIRVHAGVKPDPKTAMLLLGLFKAVFKHMKREQEQKERKA